jgi:hypothetical protein
MISSSSQSNITTSLQAYSITLLIDILQAVAHFLSDFKLPTVLYTP